MSRSKRWLSRILTPVLACALVLPAHAVDPLADRFAGFLIDSVRTDAPERDVHVELFRRDEAGAFRADDAVRYRCSVNETFGEAAFFIQPTTDRVWVEVDYLTDVDGNGVYEMLDGEASPVNDIMTTDGSLVSRTDVTDPWKRSSYSLSKGRTYVLSSETLKARGQEALAARSTSDSDQTLPLSPSDSPDILYFVTLRCLSDEDQQEYTLSYYLSLNEAVPVPSDVDVNAWYYGAAEFALRHGFITGTGEDTWSPAGAVTRAQLAQILWRLGGSQMAEFDGFGDVASGDWFYRAVSWCSLTEIMEGTGDGFEPDSALSREVLAVVLRNFVDFAGLDVNVGADISQYVDNAAISDWARTSMEWAVEVGVFSGYEDDTLRPANGLSRAELAAVLRTFCQTFPDAVSLS